MTTGRFILAGLAGMAFCYWLTFLFVAGGMAGEIYFDGNVRGQFVPGYLAHLYLPPLIAAALGYAALRRSKSE